LLRRNSGGGVFGHDLTATLGVAEVSKVRDRVFEIFSFWFDKC